MPVKKKDIHLANSIAACLVRFNQDIVGITAGIAP